jgi:hypothetical protein
MLQNPHLMLSMAQAQHRQMISAAERHNQLSAARRYRRAVSRLRSSTARGEVEAGVSAAGRSEGNLAPCGGDVAEQVG